MRHSSYKLEDIFQLPHFMLDELYAQFFYEEQLQLYYKQMMSI